MSDRVETEDDNPDSRVAWKARAERLESELNSKLFHWQKRAQTAEAELSRLSGMVEDLDRTVKRRDRSAETSRKFWIRAAKSALAGDTRELRNRVELAEAGPVEIVLSDTDPQAPASKE